MIEKNLLPIRDRILKALEEMDENRQRRGKYPKGPGLHNTMIRRLVEKEALPSAKNMVKLCVATGLSSDYFYFGEQAAITRLTLSDYQESYINQKPAAVDMDRISRIVTETEKYYDDHRLKISGSRKGKLVAMLYEHEATEGEKITPATIKAYLRLTH